MALNPDLFSTLAGSLLQYRRAELADFPADVGHSDLPPSFRFYTRADGIQRILSRSRALPTARNFATRTTPRLERLKQR